jgi:flagellar hook-length control protein FliK
VLSAKIEAESQMARAVLLDNLPQLRDRLSEQGVQIENFDVDVSDHSTDHAQQQTDDAHNHAEHPADQSSADKQQQEDQGSPTETPSSLSKGKLNIVV